MKRFGFSAALMALLATAILIGCASSGTLKAKAFRIPLAPPEVAAPPRPSLAEGDVIDCVLTLPDGGEAARICWRPTVWMKMLRYILALDTHAGVQAVRLRAHIQKLEAQIGEMNRFIEGKE